MKYLLSLFLLIPCVSNAQQGIQNVHEVATSTGSIVQTMSVSSQTVTGVAVNTSSGTLLGAFAIEVYNLQANSKTVNCGFDLSLSSTSSSAWYGREVPPGVGVYFAVPSYRTLYCLTQDVTAATRVTVTQFK